MKTLACLLMISGPLLPVSRCSTQGPPVPSVYQDLYSQLSTDIHDFDGAITSMWNGSKYPVTFSGQLTDANSNNGPALLRAKFALFEDEISYLKNIGVKAIAVEVSFPMLYQPFFESIGQPGYQAQFSEFYANIAKAIRARGMQVIVESQSMMPTGLDSVWGRGLRPFYAGISTFEKYGNARAQTIGVVANTMRPDYFVLQEEPDTEAYQSRQVQAYTVEGSTRMLDGSILAARKANIPGMKIGAGFGSWLQAFQLFANSFTQQQCGKLVTGPKGPVRQPCLSRPLDFLDMHVFPVNEHTISCTLFPNKKPCAYPNFWRNALTIVATAKAANKPVTIAQTWLRKVRDNEWLQIPGAVQEAREAYNFWAPLDSAFLKTIYDLANYAQMLFVVPFNTQNLATYLTWRDGSSTCTIPACTALRDEGGGNTPAAVFGAVQAAGIHVISRSDISSTGTSFRALIQPRNQYGPPLHPAP